MEQVWNWVTENWFIVIAGVAGLLGGGGLAFRFWSNSQSGNSNNVDQSNAKAKGDIVGRDKKVSK